MRTALVTLFLALVVAVAGLLWQVKRMSADLALVQAQRDTAVEAQERLLAARKAEGAILVRRDRERGSTAAMRLSARTAVEQASQEWAAQALPKEVADAVR